MYKLGSLFDGSGGFPLAGALCGIEPTWASEVEPYPIAVTKTRIPGMKHLGDISKINGAEIEPVDIITFGSPCQDLSVAGKRAGLKHEDNGDEETTRSGLFMEAVRIIKEMREATNGKYPTFALWENVPGAFSSNKGEDFRTVLEELIKIAEPSAIMPAVPKNGWPYADYYVGDGWSLAYRVFDAQYWGVPQRRRRIHLVVDFRGERAGEVLFKREGVRGYFTQSGETWEGTAAAAQGSTGAADREGEGAVIGFDGYNRAVTGNVAKNLMATRADSDSLPTVFVPYTLKIRSGCEGGGKGALIQEDKSATLSTLNDQYLFQPIGINGDTAGTLDSSYYKGCGMRQGIEREVVAIPIHDQATRYIGNRGERQDGKGNGLGVGKPGDAMNTLTGGDRHAVCFSQQAIGEYKESEKASSLKARDYKDATDLVKIEYIIRRLTPTECARIQGFGIVFDRWGDIEEKTDFSDAEYIFWLEVRNTHAVINGREEKVYTKAQMLTWYNKLQTDSAEYKMWGNGIALPPALYCMQGIAEALIAYGAYETDESDATDLSDAPQEIKEEIMENAERLEQKEMETAMAAVAPVENPAEIRETKTEAPAEPERTTGPAHDFNAAEQLKQLAKERKALADMKPENDRFKNDVRALEYALGVLEVVGL